MSTLITRDNTVLKDSQMPLYNKERNQKIFMSEAYWDHKDKDYKLLAKYFPVNASVHEYVIPDFTPISDQGPLGSCVANSWCDTLEILMGLESPTSVKQLSRLFAYWTFRDLVGLQREDLGTYNRAGAQQIRNVGVVEEKYFPYDTKKVYTSPGLDLYAMASNYRINSFYRITSTDQAKITDIEKAIRANHPVIVATIVGDEFKKYRGGGQVLSMPKSWSGLHAMICIGVRVVNNKRQFRLRNSWGRSWGDKGYVWVDEDYMKSKHTQDLWVGTRIKSVL